MTSYGQEQAVLNRVWSQLILEELTRFGVRQICIAPGSRSTPLTLEADANSLLTIHTHFDERGLGFFALGMAKATNAPVAVVVTSGTAVANLLPAIAEANLTGEKLVILSANRPKELIDCGANQAIEQNGIFASHVVASLNLPTPCLSVPPTWLLTSLDQLLYKQCHSGSVVHINCPFPEPLYTQLSKTIFSDYLQPLLGWQDDDQPYTVQQYESVPAVQTLSGAFSDKKGVVIAASLDLQDALAAQRFASAMGFPLLCDPQSGISSGWAHYDLWLQVDEYRKKLAECDLIIQFGARMVSKRLNTFIRSQCSDPQCDYWLISPQHKRLNPDHLRQTHVVANASVWVQQQLSFPIKSECDGWADGLIKHAAQISELLKKDRTLTELNLAVHLSELAGGQDLFIGNSLIVRLVDMASRLEQNRVYANRGASGIDGLIATAAGVQRANASPMLVLIGDTSLLYDINSLALFCQTKQPVVILVTNNDGGAIFDLLPVPDQQKQFLYRMPHGFTFEHAASQFRLGYLVPDSLDSLLIQVSYHLSSGSGTLLVEVQTPQGQAATDIRQRIEQIHALH